MSARDFIDAVAAVDGMAAPLQPEVEEGNVEYKLKLVSVTKQRRIHLASQMNWRLLEAPLSSSPSSLVGSSGGAAEAYYMVGYQDDGCPVGLGDDDLVTSLRMLRSIAATINAEVSVVAVRWGKQTQQICVIRGSSEPAVQRGTDILTTPTKVAEVRVRRVLLGDSCGILGASDGGNGSSGVDHLSTRIKELSDNCKCGGAGGGRRRDRSSSGTSTASANASLTSSSSSSSSSDDDEAVGDERHEESDLLQQRLAVPMVVAAVGDASAGKTTLAAVLATGELDNGRGLARMQVLRHHHEIADEGHTSSRAPVLLAFDAAGGVANFDERTCGGTVEASDEAQDAASALVGTGSAGGRETCHTWDQKSQSPPLAWGTRRNSSRCIYGPGFGNSGGSGCDGSGGSSGSFVSSSFSASELLRKASAPGGKLVELLDLAGHRKYLKTTVAGLVSGSGCASPDYAMLVVDAVAACENDVSKSGPAKNWPLGAMGTEHLTIARALGLRVFVVVTKCERCNLLSLERVLRAVSDHLVGLRVNQPLAGASDTPFQPVYVKTRRDVLDVCERLGASNRPIGEDSDGATATDAVPAPIPTFVGWPIPVPILSVSAVTGAGMGLLRELLYRLPPNPRSVRRAVDRIFGGFALVHSSDAESTVSDPLSSAIPADIGALSEADTTGAKIFVRVDNSFEVEGAPGLVLAGAVQLGSVSVGMELLMGPMARRVPLGACSDETAAPLSGSEAKPRPHQRFEVGAAAQCKGSCEEEDSNKGGIAPSFFCRVRVTSIHLHGMAVASIATGQVATFAVSAVDSGLQSSLPDVWPLERRCKGMVLVGYSAKDLVPIASKPQVALEFDAEVIFLHGQQHPGGQSEQPQVDHEPMIYVQSVAQTARIVSIHPTKDGVSACFSAVPASVAPQSSGPVISRTLRQHAVLRIRFQFVHRPEFVSVGDWLFLRDGSRGAGSFARMGLGRILKRHLIRDLKGLVDHSRGTTARRKANPTSASTSSVSSQLAKAEVQQPDFWA